MNKVTLGLILAMVFQVLVLVGMLVSASWPLTYGQEIRLETVPVDPRSLFRGNYAVLNYKISTVASQDIPNIEKLRHGEIVYVALEVKEGTAVDVGVSLHQPDQGLYIRGRLQYPDASRDTQQIKYGIEAYFAPKERAIELERQLAQDAVAVVMVTNAGKAGLKAVVER